MDIKGALIRWIINSAWLTDRSASGSGVKSKVMSNQESAEELHKQIIRKFEISKVYPSFKDNI